MTFQGQDRYVRGFVVDDALYYPIIARNIVDQGMQSFDGLTTTNGFHPLLAYLLTAIFRVSPLDSAADLWTLRVLIFLLNLAAAFMYTRVLQKAGFRSLAIAAFLLTMFVFWRPFMTYYAGLETPLVNFLIGWSLWAALRLRENPSQSRTILAALLLGLAFLARLDSIFIVGLLALYLLAVVLRGQRRRQWALVIAGLAVTLPYVLSNWLVFGNMIPGSGLRKTAIGGSSESALVEILYTIERRVHAVIPSTIVSYGVTALAVIAAVIAVVIFFRRTLRRDRRPLDELLALCGIGALLHFGYITLFMIEGHVFWYHYPMYLLVACAVAYGVEWLTDQRKRWPIARGLPVMIAAYAVLLLALWGHKFYWNPRAINAASANIALGQWVRDNTLPAAIFLMYDPGIFALYSQRRTITINALAGDRFIRECFRENNIQKIIDRFDPDYVVVEQGVDVPDGNRFHTAFPPNAVIHASHEYLKTKDLMQNIIVPASVVKILGGKGYLP